MTATIIPSYYGRTHLGAIQGLLTGLLISGTALGPLLLGWGHDYYGSYSYVLVRMAVLPAMLIVLFLNFLERPTHPLDRG
jgi:MFS family permease